MKVTLEILNDAELRNHVKELISGQVKSVIREEIKDILKDILSKKIKDTDIPNVDFLVKEEINKMVKNELGSSSWNNPSFVRVEARKMIDQYLKDAFSKSSIIS